MIVHSGHGINQVSPVGLTSLVSSQSSDALHILWIKALMRFPVRLVIDGVFKFFLRFLVYRPFVPQRLSVYSSPHTQVGSIIAYTVRRLDQKKVSLKSRRLLFSLTRPVLATFLNIHFSRSNVQFVQDRFADRSFWDLANYGTFVQGNTNENACVWRVLNGELIIELSHILSCLVAFMMMIFVFSHSV